MSKRIQHLSESPCYQCSKSKECMEKIKRNPCLIEISDSIMGDADFDYKNCSIFQSIILGEMAKTTLGNYYCKVFEEESNVR